MRRRLAVLLALMVILTGLSLSGDSEASATDTGVPDNQIASSVNQTDSLLSANATITIIRTTPPLPDDRIMKIVTGRGCGVVGETRDVNGDVLDTVLVTLYEEPAEMGDEPEDSDSSTIVGNVTKYANCPDDTGYYWQNATRYGYKSVDTRPRVDGGGMPPVRNPAYPDYIDLSTPELLNAGFTMNFVGDYGLVPKTVSKSYAMESINHWLYTPVDEYGTPQPDWQLSNWKAMQSVHFWQFPPMLGE
jgi:hypothetical protein